MPNAALILAAGRGSRIQDFTSDKILAPLGGRPAVAYSFAAFLDSGCVSTIAIIYRDEPQRQAIESVLAGASESASSNRRLPDFLWVRGGSERQDSVLSGLRALPEESGYVFIHDAARPLISPEAIRLLAQKAKETGAACLARRITDTVKQVRPASDLALDACVLETIDRSRLWAVETPQVFERLLILSAYEKISASGQRVTDDTSALEESGHPIALVESPFPNPKLTTPADVAFIEYLLSEQSK